MTVIQTIQLEEITVEWLKLNKPELIHQIVKEANQKDFLRPSNIWRLIGIFIAVTGLFVPTFIVGDWKGVIQVTTNSLFLFVGFLIVLIPSLKEIFPALTNLVMAIRGNKPNQPESESIDLPKQE